MENEMIERVAKAMIAAAEAGRRGDFCSRSNVWDEDCETLVTERGLIYDGTINMDDMARAAIEAMHDALKDQMAINESIYGAPKDAAHLWGRIENALDTSPEWRCGDGPQKTPLNVAADPG